MPNNDNNTTRIDKVAEVLAVLFFIVYLAARSFYSGGRSNFFDKVFKDHPYIAPVVALALALLSLFHYIRQLSRGEPLTVLRFIYILLFAGAAVTAVWWFVVQILPESPPSRG